MTFPFFCKSKVEGEGEGEVVFFENPISTNKIEFQNPNFNTILKREKKNARFPNSFKRVAI